MKKRVIRILGLFASITLVVDSALAQDNKSSKPQSTPDATGKASGGAGKISTPTKPSSTTKILITSSTTPVELARAAYLAQGGNKYRDLKSMLLTGSVDLFGPNSLQSIPGKFAIVTAGERSRTEFQSIVFNLRQISDGTRTYSSVPGMEMPPPTKFGISVLMKYDQPGYVVTALPDNKKLRAFRITDPDGNATDFFVAVDTARVMTFVVPYRGLTFGMEFKSFKEMDGVLLPMSFTQRIEMQQGAAFADFKVKESKLNFEIADDMFAIPEP
jgi:hypothetical protein